MPDENPYIGLVDGGQPPADAGNPYADIVRQMFDAQEQQAQGSMYSAAQGPGPDHAARAQALGQQFNVPASVIGQDLPSWEAKARLQQNNAVLRADPSLMRWVAAQPHVAAVAQDDMQNLSTLGKIGQGLVSGWTPADIKAAAGKGAQQAVLSNELGRLRFDANPETAQRQAEIEAKLREPDGQGYSLPGFVARTVSGLLAGLVDQASHAKETAIVGAGLGGTLGLGAAGIGAGPGAAAGFGVGVMAGMAADAYRVAAGNMRATLHNAVGANGETMPQIAVEGASMVAGFANAWLNTVGLRFGFGPVAKDMGLVLQEAAAQAATRATYQQAATKIATGFMRTGATGAGLGLAMEGSNIVAEQAARAFAPGDFATVFNDPAQRQQAVNRLAESMVTMAVGMAALHGPSLGGHFLSDAMAARRANIDHANLTALLDGAEGSATRTRSPGLFMDWLRQQTDGTPVENLFIPADRVRELYQGFGHEPGPDDALLGRVAPDIADQLRQAEATRGDVVLPTAAFATHLAGTDVAKALLPDVRARPDAYSLREAHEMAAAVEAMRRDYETEMAGGGQRAPAQLVFDDVQTQARQAGFSADAARQYAALYAARYATRAERLGVGPYELWKAENVRLRADAPELIRAIPASDLDVMIQALRSGKPEVGARQLFGPSLLEWLSRRGGVVDEGGDLMAMGAGEWHRGRVGWGRLLRPEEQDAGAALPGFVGGDKAPNRFGLDETARAAWEAGYLPGVERPDINALREAVRQELAGKTIYAGEGVDQKRAAFEAATRDLDETLQRLGIDPKKASNAEIRVVLQREFADTPGKTLFQPVRAPDAPRGSIQFGDGERIITMFRSRDLSTMLHESGHLWLEEMANDAVLEHAPPQIRDDMAAIRAFLGNEGGEFTTDQHETFARAFETYLMEGKAPSAGLAGAFSRFKAWLVSIYRSVANLNAPISPEMRDVFDRMLATDAEIAQARQAQGLRELFTSAQEAGMTDAEFAAYRQSVEAARTGADEALLKRTMADVRRRMTAWWKDEEAPIRAEVTQGIDARPEFAALHVLRTGLLPGVEGEPVRMRLDREAVIAMFGSDEAASMMPKTVPPILAREGGVHPDVLAEMVGLRSGEELVRKLMGIEQQRRDLRDAGDKRSPRQYLIDEEVQSRMVERHGDVLSDGSIQQAALDAIHSDKQLDVMATELRALGRQRGEPATPAQVARQWAARLIAEKSVRDATDTQQFARAEAKAGKAALDAILAGDKDEAFRQRQAQMLNHALFMEAKRAGDDVDRAVRFISRFAEAETRKDIPQDYLEQIHALTDRFDFSRASAKEVGKREALADWVRGQRDAGYEPAVPDKLLDEAFTQHYTTMAVDDLRGLHDAVRSIVHLGRLKQELLDRQEKRAFDEIVGEAVDAVGQLRQVRQDNRRNPTVAGNGLDRLRAMVATGQHYLKMADASMLKMEQVFQWLDNGDSNGVFNRVVFRRLSEAQVREHDLQKTMSDRFRELQDRVGSPSRKELRTLVDTPELINPQTGQPYKFTKGEILAIALNAGNEGNWSKMLEGEKWNAANVRAVLDRVLTKRDWDFVQGVWDTIGTLWPEIADLQKRVSGVEPEKVAAWPVETPHGTYEGGYYPVVYDPTRSADVEANRQRSAAAMFENNYTRATTAQGHTIARTSYARPLDLSLDVLPRHVQQVVHDLAWREAVMDADRFLSDKRVAQAVTNALGREYYQQFKPWLQSIANDKAFDQRGVAFWEKLAHTARTNTTMVGLGFRVTTMVIHGISAALNSVGEVGVGPMTKAVGTFMRDPAGARDFVFERSGEMRNRMNEIDRDMRDALRDVLGDDSKMAQVRRFSMQGVAMLDFASALPTWLAAYRNGLERQMPDADAVYFADQSVRNAHGGAGAKDVAAIQRGGEVMKLFTMFYSFWNHLYNRQRDLAHDARNIRSVGDFGAVLARSFFYLIAPPVIHGLIAGSGGAPDEDHSWLGWAASHIGLGLISGVPVLRDIGSAIGHGTDYRATPAADAITKAITLGKDVAGALDLIDKEPSDRWLRHAIETPGYLLGLPTGQAAGAAQFLWDVWDGREDPQGVAEWLQGVIYGPKPKKAH